MAGYYGYMLDVRVSIHRMSVRFSFLDDNLSKHQWIFSKLGMCIDIVDLFVCVEVLQPSQPNGVMSSAVSLPNHTLSGQA